MPQPTFGEMADAGIWFAVGRYKEDGEFVGFASGVTGSDPGNFEGFTWDQNRLSPFRLPPRAWTWISDIYDHFDLGTDKLQVVCVRKCADCQTVWVNSDELTCQACQ